MSRTIVLTAGLCLAALTGACGRGTGPFVAGAQPASGAIAVHVVNSSFRTVDVYVISQGVASRMGTVVAAGTGNYVLDPSFVGSSDLRLVATPIGGNGRAFSGPLVASAGQTIEFDISPRLRDSMAVVR